MNTDKKSDEKKLMLLQKEAEEALRKGDKDRFSELLLTIVDEGPDLAYGLFQLGKLFYQAGEIEEAVEKLSRALGQAPDMISARFLLGKIFLEKKDTSKAIEQFRAVVSLDPSDHEAYFLLAETCLQAEMNDEALALLHEAHNLEPNEPAYYEALGALYFRRNEYPQAYNYLSHETLRESGRIETLNLLAEAAGKIGNIAIQVNAYERSLQLKADQPEIASALDAIRKKSGNSVTGAVLHRKKIAFFSNIDSFLGDIIDHLKKSYEVKKFNGKSLDDIAALMSWSDLSWFEWCDELLIHASKLPKTSPIICRLHRYEAFTPYPEKVNWNNVDHIIFVSRIIENVVREMVDLQIPVSYIPNGVNFDRYHFDENRKHDKKIAYVGYINSEKGPELLLQCFSKIHRYDPEYTFHIAGQVRFKQIDVYFENILKELDIPLSFDGWIDPVSEWLKDKDFIISSSRSEGHPYAILEGIASGLLPLVHNWPGSKLFYPEECIFNTVDECLEIVKKYETCDKKKVVKQYRNLIQERFSLEKQLESIDELMAEYL